MRVNNFTSVTNGKLLSYFCFLTTELTKIEVWKLWKQDRLEQITDPVLGWNCSYTKMQEENEVFRTCSTEYEVICIQANVFLNFRMFLHFCYVVQGTEDGAKQNKKQS